MRKGPGFGRGPSFACPEAAWSRDAGDRDVSGCARAFRSAGPSQTSAAAWREAWRRMGARHARGAVCRPVRVIPQPTRAGGMATPVRRADRRRQRATTAASAADGGRSLRTCATLAGRGGDLPAARERRGGCRSIRPALVEPGVSRPGRACRGTGRSPSGRSAVRGRCPCRRPGPGRARSRGRRSAGSGGRSARP